MGLVGVFPAGDAQTRHKAIALFPRLVASKFRKGVDRQIIRAQRISPKSSISLFVISASLALGKQMPLLPGSSLPRMSGKAGFTLHVKYSSFYLRECYLVLVWMTHTGLS